jgi:acetyltransferase
VVYLEGISNSRRFMSALRAAANAKPVVVLKAGRKTAGNKAARTHSGAIVGSDDVFDAALRRAGAVRVRSFVALFSAAKCLASRYRAVGRRLAIITNGGGPGVLAADWISEINLQLGQLSAASAEALKAVLPAQASLCDLIDLSEDASPEHYRLGAGRRQQGKGDRRDPRHPLAEDRLRCRGSGRCAGGFQGPHQQALAHLLDGRCLGG